jgi:hypothetical protein
VDVSQYTSAPDWGSVISESGKASSEFVNGMVQRFREQAAAATEAAKKAAKTE